VIKTLSFIVSIAAANFLLAWVAAFFIGNFFNRINSKNAGFRRKLTKL